MFERFTWSQRDVLLELKDEIAVDVVRVLRVVGHTLLEPPLDDVGKRMDDEVGSNREQYPVLLCDGLLERASEFSHRCDLLTIL